MITDFKDKVTVITGAVYGISNSLAHSFAQSRAKLALVDIKEKSFNELAEVLSKNG